MVTEQIKPNFLGIGAQKAGTTWLHHNLQQHPQVWLPPYKEIHYFDQIHLDKSQIIEKNRLVILRNELDKTIQGETVSYSYLNFLANIALSEVRNDQWYLSLFSSAVSKRAIGEITPGYSILPEAGVKHIKSLLGDVKLIYILRNPVKRAWSQAIMSKRPEISQNKCIEDEEWIKTTEMKYHTLKSDYIKTITTYEKYFEPKQILYLFYDDIYIKPLNLLHKICNFLNLEYEDNFFSKNTLGVAYNKNPKVDIPEAVEQHLIKKYKKQEEWIRERFQPTHFQL